MKLAIYTIEVHAPDNWEDNDWPESNQTKLDELMSLNSEALITKIKEIYPHLTVRYLD